MQYTFSACTYTPVIRVLLPDPTTEPFGATILNAISVPSSIPFSSVHVCCLLFPSLFPLGTPDPSRHHGPSSSL